ncbi:MAG: hypothetical protein K1X89_27285 [Myxococcaceae bacterium]|nr:hypothetical protein [Myxococcaceae bacterium]
MPSESAKVVRSAYEKLRKAFTERVAARGFVRARSAFWVRENGDALEVIHLFRSGSSFGSFGSSVEVVVSFAKWPRGVGEGPLNGPSDTRPALSWRPHLRFDARSFDRFDRCLDDLMRLVVEVGEPWFPRGEAERMPAADSPVLR